MAKRQTQKVKGCKKAGRSRKWCEAYRSRGQREINKAKRLARHIRKFPNDQEAIRVLEKGRSLSYSRGVFQDEYL